MRKQFKKGKTFPMKLQFFSETAEPDGGDVPASDDGGDVDHQNEPKSFDDLLKDVNYQAEFSRRLNQALDEQKEKLEVLFSEKTTEAEKLAKMNKEEKAAYEQQKREKQISDRETAVMRKELMAEAKNTLAEKRLPVSLANVLNYASADTCKDSIAAVEQAFQEALQAAVEEKLKGGEPIKKATSDASFTQEQVMVMSPEDINKHWDAISKSMETWSK